MDKKLIRVLIDEIEWYPVYTVEKSEECHWGHEAEISEELYKKWGKITEDFLNCKKS